MSTYNVTVEGTTTGVNTVAEVKELLGDRKVTKKGIEEGLYPMVTLATATTEDTATEEVAVTVTGDTDEPVAPTDTKSGIEIVHVGDAPKGGKLVVEPNDTEEPTEPPVEPTEPPVEPNDTEVEPNDTEEPKEPISMVDVAELIKQGFVVGATVAIHEDSMNEQLLMAFLDADIDQAIIKAISPEGVVLTVKGLEDTVIPTADLTVLAPPKPAKADTKGKKNTKLVVDPDKDGYPEVGQFDKDEAGMKKYIKALSNEQLQEWCELEGATWNPHDNVSINRMRMAMAIKAKHFPHLSAGTGNGTKKSKAKYGHLSNEDLAKMCLDGDVEVRDAKGDARIERMYMIMDLRKAGVIE